jgi:periplasmic nitrate reductase NapD
MSASNERNRRGFLGLGPRAAQSPELHISSLIVHARPEKAVAVAAGIERLPGTEIHQRTEAGKLIVTLETERTGAVLDRLSAIQDLPGVVSAALVYHQWEAANQAESEAGHESDASQLPEG